MHQKRRALALFFAVFLVNTTYGIFDDPFLIEPVGFFDDLLDESLPENRGKSVASRFYNKLFNGPGESQ